MSAVSATAQSVSARRRSKSRMKLEMEELPEAELNGKSSSSVGATEQCNSSTNNTDAMPEMPGPEWKYEPVMRNAIHTLLQETSHDEDQFAFLREVCQETLARKQRASMRGSAVAESLRSPSTSGNNVTSTRKVALASSTMSEGGDTTLAGKILLAPKSPQERLMALVPNAIEKSKRSYQRRASPKYVTAITAI